MGLWGLLRHLMSVGLNHVIVRHKDPHSLGGNEYVLAQLEVEDQEAFEGEIDLSDAAVVGLTGRVRGGALPSPLAVALVSIDGGELRAEVDLASLSLNVERLDLDTAHGAMSLIGQAGLAGPSPGVSLALSFGAMPIEVARAFWPPFIASKTRRNECSLFAPAIVLDLKPKSAVGESPDAARAAFDRLFGKK